MSNPVGVSTRPSWLRRIVRFPLTRIVIAVAIVGGSVLIAATVIRVVVNSVLPLDRYPPLALASAVAVGGAGLWSYAWFVRWIEQRRPTEVALRRAAPDLLQGLLVGTCLYAFTVGLIGIFADASLTASGVAWRVVIGAFAGALLTATVEEIVARGIVLRLLEELLGTWPALLLTALVFGVLHLSRPHASWGSAVAVASTAGLVLGGAFLYRRSLWLPIGLHLGWNFTEGGIFGGVVSGKEAQGLLATTLTGPTWITGGAFGVEASLVLLLVTLPVTAFFLRRAVREQTVRAPWWMGRMRMAP